MNTPEVFAKMQYDWAISSNTLEHIEDDKKALYRIVENARMKTAIILVPALSCLYGTCDHDGGHLRRYSKVSFKKLTEDTGLKLDGFFYFNMLGAIAWWVQYVLLRIQNYSDKSHLRCYTIFDRYITPSYSKLEGKLDCPFGLSLVARVTLADSRREI